MNKLLIFSSNSLQESKYFPEYQTVSVVGEPEDNLMDQLQNHNLFLSPDNELLKSRSKKTVFDIVR